MKYLDSTAKDVLMGNFGMALNVHGILPAQVGIHGTVFIEDAMQKLFHAHKMRNGTELCVFALQDII